MRFSDGKSEHVSCLPSYILDPRALPARHKSSLFAPVFASVSVSEHFPSLFVFFGSGVSYLGESCGRGGTGSLTERVRDLLRRWIDAKTGRRSDVPHYFIYNQAHNERLHVVTSVHVSRVLLECVPCRSLSALSFADRQ